MCMCAGRTKPNRQRYASEFLSLTVNAEACGCVLTPGSLSHCSGKGSNFFPLSAIVSVLPPPRRCPNFVICVSQPTCSVLITVSSMVNKYPGGEIFPSALLHLHKSPSTHTHTVDEPDSIHDYTVTTAVFHPMPKPWHCTPSYTQTHTQESTELTKNRTF